MIHSDGGLAAVELCLDTARALRGGGPWGQGFPEPVFDGDFHIVDARIVGGKHLKMQLRVADGPSGGPIEAIAFGYVGGDRRGSAAVPAAREFSSPIVSRSTIIKAASGCN